MNDDYDNDDDDDDDESQQSPHCWPSKLQSQCPGVSSQHREKILTRQADTYSQEQGICNSKTDLTQSSSLLGLLYHMFQPEQLIACKDSSTKWPVGR